MHSQFSRSGACFSLHTWYERWDFPSRLACFTGILYMEWSLPTSLPAGLLVWPWISVLAPVSNASRLFRRKFPAAFFSCLFCYARCVHWPLPGRTDERKVSSTTLLSSFQTNNVTASGMICPHHFYFCCSPNCSWFILWCALPWRWCVNKYIFMGNG